MLDSEKGSPFFTPGFQQKSFVAKDITEWTPDMLGTEEEASARWWGMKFLSEWKKAGTLSDQSKELMINFRDGLLREIISFLETQEHRASVIADLTQHKTSLMLLKTNLQKRLEADNT